MAAQLPITAYFPAVSLDSKGLQIKRLHSECLLSYKLCFFGYDAKHIPCDADKRTYWFFIDATLPINHPLNPRTFRRILFSRHLTLGELKVLSCKFYDDDEDFRALSLDALLARVFSEQELLFAANEVA